MCVTAQMSLYDASGFSCTLSGITFSNFNFTDSNPPPTDSQVTVIPTTDAAGNVTLEFDGAFSAGAGSSMSASISYLVMASTPVLTGEALAMTGFGQNGNGGVNIGESICLGGAYSAGICGGTGVDSLTVFDDGPNDIQAVNGVVFTTPQSEIGVVKNIAISGGTAGTDASATLSEVFNTTGPSGGSGRSGGGPVPEPGTMAMMGFGLLVSALGWRRRSHG